MAAASRGEHARSAAAHDMVDIVEHALQSIARTEGTFFMTSRSNHPARCL
jgi:hypothetical protein